MKILYNSTGLIDREFNIIRDITSGYIRYPFDRCVLCNTETPLNPLNGESVAHSLCWLDASSDYRNYVRRCYAEAEINNFRIMNKSVFIETEQDFMKIK